MSFLLDTNVCSAHIRRPSGLAHRFIQFGGRLHVPTVVLAELYAWAYRRTPPAQLLSAIADLLSDLQILTFDGACAEQFGRLHAELARAGRPMNAVDQMIASVALVHGLTLVTHNVEDFRHVPDLRIEDWLAP